MPCNTSSVASACAWSGPLPSVRKCRPVPSGCQRLRKRIATSAVCAFAEPQFDTRLVDAVIEGTPARMGTIDPEGARIEPGPDLYETLLRNLAQDLERLSRPAGIA